MIYMFFNFDIKASDQATIITNPYLWFALIIVTLVVFFMILILLINKYIFDPIFAMKRTAEHIKSGNLNYPIVYSSEKEIGEFCIEFDKMRIRLRYKIF